MDYQTIPDVTTVSRSWIATFLKEAQRVLSPDVYDFVSRETWLRYARRERPRRALKVLLFLIEQASLRKAVKFTDIANQIEGCYSHNERMCIIKLIGRVCRENHWPPYAVLIKRDKEASVGSGFFRDYGLGGSVESLQEIESAMTKACYDSCPPDFMIIQGAFAAVEQARKV